MVSVPNILARPLPPEPVVARDTIFENGSVPTTKDNKARSQSVPEVLPSTFSPPLRSPPLKKYCYEDFEYLKVLGKGSFGKVMHFITMDLYSCILIMIGIPCALIKHRSLLCCQVTKERCSLRG